MPMRWKSKTAAKQIRKTLSTKEKKEKLLRQVIKVNL